MTSSPEFDAAYARLNPEQKLAVDTIDGPVFVIAGPGTGKTQILTLRIANILRETDTPPESILALTFTEAAAHEMRERLRKIIGARANKVRFHTFHGFAQDLINRFPDQFPRIIGAQILTDVERAEIFDAVLLSSPVRHLRPFGDPLYYHSPVARAISTMKRENVTPEVLEERVREANEEFENIEGKVHEKGKYEGKMKGEYVTFKKKIEKTEDLLVVYRAYEEALTNARRYDFDDLILEAVHALETDETFRLQAQESVLYILADEHQDANRAQNALLESISGFHDRPNLFIVGDEKQAIYRFQGADLDNVQYFRTKYEGTQIITLVENYRSTQSILDTALSLVAASPDERLSRVPLIARAEHEAKPISKIPCQTADQEMVTLSTNVSDAIATGTPAGEIAVLVRRNSDVAEVAYALARSGIPVTGGGEEDALKNRFVQALLRLLRAAAEPRDEYLAGVLTLPGFPLSAADIARITQFARKEKRTVLSVLGDEIALGEAKVRKEGIAHAKALGASIEELSRMASFERPASVAERALQRSGLLPRALVSADRADALAAIRALLLAFEDLSRREHGALLTRGLALLDLYSARNISLLSRGGEDTTRVKVMTVHRSKGREFARVFVPLLTTTAWSTRSRAEHFYLPDILSGSNELEDERRLLYVAITRAKQHATLSYSFTGHDGRTQEPSELIDDLNPELVEEVTPATTSDDSFLTSIDANSNKEKKTEADADDLATLRAIFFAQGLSPTALNNYLECSWKYFYVNLLRIPEIENKYMLFGTAIHAALKRYADGRANDTDIGVAGLMETFTYSLERSPLSEREVTEMHEKGKKALSAWWEERHTSWPETTRAEIPVQADISLEKGGKEGEEEVLRIRGILDRIDETQNGVSVIDYKTGKPKSRNELMGATKDSNGNYYRQLTFYKLLLARTEEKRDMREGIIDFVEPDDKGKTRSEAFTITDEEVNELEALIKKALEKS